MEKAAISRSEKLKETNAEDESVRMEIEEPEDGNAPENSNPKSKTSERNKTISAAKVESLKDQMKYLLNRHRLLEQDVYEVS